jgi:quercetin dioxygenase-like cupin family protein
MNRRLFVSMVAAGAASALWMIAGSGDATGAALGKLTQYDSMASLQHADHPTAARPIITRVTSDRATNLQDPMLSAFLVDYPPGGSVVLHRMPSSGYVLVHVLSGTIHASAWHAGVGTYRAGQTWVEPAFAYSIVAKNPSPDESARTLVVLVGGSQDPDGANDTPQPK